MEGQKVTFSGKDKTVASRPLRTGLRHPLTPAQRAVQEQARAFSEDVIAPIASDLDTSGEYSEALAEHMRDSGLQRYYVTEEFGGFGLSVTNICLIREQLGRVSVAADEFFASQGIAIQPILVWGNEDTRHRYAERFLKGESLFAYCMTEPNAGSDVGSIATKANQRNGAFILHGKKRFIYASDRSDVFLVLARTEPMNGVKGISALLFDRPESGIKVSRYPLMLPSPTYEIEFDGCRVPQDSVLGQRGQGVKVALSNLDRLRPTVGAYAVGMASRALEAAIDYVSNRQAFGGRLGDLPTIRHDIAEASAQLDAARLVVYGAAANADNGEDGIDVAATSAKAKYFATETAQRIIDLALQLHGGSGLALGSVTERFYRAIRAARIYEGTSEIMKLVIARSVMARD